MLLNDMVQRLTTNGFKNAKLFFKMRSWAEGYIFNVNKEGDHWWAQRHVNGAKSGTTFPSKEECEESALIHFLNNLDVKSILGINTEE